MKLESFKFQDGKVFWLPGYPEKPIINACLGTEDLWDEYYKDIAKSLASALELTQEDKDRVIKLILARHTFGGNVNMWYPKKDKVYSAECEMEKVEKCSLSKPFAEPKCDCDDLCTRPKKVARLKLKDEIFPAANSHDMKEELWDFSSTQEAKDFLRYYFKRYHAMKDEAIEILIFEEVEGFRKSLIQTTK